MRRTLLKNLALALPLVLLLGGCGRKNVAKAEGTYTLDQTAFVKQALKALIDSGRIPASATALGQRKLERIHSTLQLKTDGTFLNVVKAPGEKTHEYEGEWTQSGNRIELHQTKEDGEDKEDFMKGTLEGDRLLLQHEEMGVLFPYPMRRQSAHPSPK